MTGKLKETARRWLRSMAVKPKEMVRGRGAVMLQSAGLIVCVPGVLTAVAWVGWSQWGLTLLGWGLALLLHGVLVDNRWFRR